ncbi:MAG: amidase [Burkholderiaceae bacterium]
MELTEACLRQVERLDGRLHAFITLMAETALCAARVAEQEIARGQWRGPLHGIPIAHKDLIRTKGVRTTAHSRFLEQCIPDEDATVHARLRSAGAICIGKTSLHEFGVGSPGPDEAFPAARHPWNIDYAPGSSSSGSAVAVAAGMCLAATGTDTGGSLRHPASVCGIVGMKPTFGRVSTHGVIPLAPSLDHVGPLTRTVADSALMLQWMAGHDPLDRCSSDRPVPDFSSGLADGVQGLSLGVPRRFIAGIPHDDEVLAAFAEALEVLKDAGARLVDVEVPDLQLANDVATRIQSYESWRYHGSNLSSHPERFGATFRERVEKGRTISRETYEADLATGRELCRDYDQVFAAGVAALLSPGRETPADTMQQLLANPARRGLTNRAYNLSGLPALTLPMGFSATGLPVGLQIAGRRFEEAQVYRVASAYEAATPWHQRFPPDCEP